LEPTTTTTTTLILSTTTTTTTIPVELYEDYGELITDKNGNKINFARFVPNK